MAEQAQSTSESPKVGEWRHPAVSDLRSPCPVLNALANHGYLPRDGRNVTKEDFKRVLHDQLNLAPDIAALLYLPVYLLHEEVLPDDITKAPIKDDKTEHPFLHGGFALPTTDRQSSLGVRDQGQVNKNDEPVLNLDQLSIHGAIEHDVSLVRRDHHQGDNTRIQPDLLEKFLGCPADNKSFTVADLTHYRNQRFKQQMEDNPKCKFGLKEKIIAWGEISMILLVFGGPIQEGYDRIPKNYLHALFAEERLPIQEGWKRRGVPIGFAEVTANSTWVQANAALDHHKD